MEYATGGDLAGLIQQKQRQDLRFTEQEVWKALIEITQGLKELHDKQILHRDIKCANIFINSDVYKLGDLNVSKIAQRGLLYTQTGTPCKCSSIIRLREPRNLARRAIRQQIGHLVTRLRTLRNVCIPPAFSRQ